MNILWRYFRRYCASKLGRQVYRMIEHRSLSFKRYAWDQKACERAKAELVRRKLCYQCPDCHLLFESWKSLKQHRADTTTVCYRSLQLVVCSECGMRYCREDEDCPVCTSDIEIYEEQALYEEIEAEREYLKTQLAQLQLRQETLQVELAAAQARRVVVQVHDPEWKRIARQMREHSHSHNDY